MNCSHENNTGKSAHSYGGFTLSFWIVLVAGLGYYLWGWHRDHVLQYWPIAIVFLCPLMHLFGGHGHHGGQTTQQEKEATK